MKIDMVRTTDEEVFLKEVNEFIKDKKIIDIKYFQEVLTEEESKFNLWGRETAVSSTFVYTAIVEYEEEE